MKPIPPATSDSTAPAVPPILRDFLLLLAVLAALAYAPYLAVRAIGGTP